MSNYRQPKVSPFFLMNSWNKATVQELKEELQKALVEDPLVESKASVSVDVIAQGAEIKEVHLIGTVASEREKQRVEEIVSTNTKNEAAIVSELTVQR